MEATEEPDAVADRTFQFIFRSQWKDYLSALQNVRGGTVSREMATALLGFSRQRMYQLIGNGTIRRWDFLEGWPHPKVVYSEVSVLDLLEYAWSNGRGIEEIDAMKTLDFNDDVRRFYEEKDKPNRIQR